MHLMTAYLVEPGYREEAFRQFNNQLDPIYNQITHTPMGVFQDRVDRFLKSNDYRSGFPKDLNWKISQRMMFRVGSNPCWRMDI